MDDNNFNPNFGDIIENGWAGRGDPHRVGIVVRTCYRKGRMNPGKYFVVTDGKGKFWESMGTAGHKLTIIGSITSDLATANERLSAAKEALDEISGAGLLVADPKKDWQVEHDYNRLVLLARNALDKINCDHD